MKYFIKKTIGAIFVSAWFVFTDLAYASCQEYSPALKAMQKVEDVIVKADGASVDIQYLIAETVSLRSAGFQHVCPETIAQEKILFVFHEEFVSTFHMNNVYAPLDIAFFDKHGVIVDIQTMYPYSMISIKKPRYRPASAAMYALETKQGFFAAAGIGIGAKLKSKSVNVINQ